MPLARYFLFVGGVLLALLFVVDAVLPTLPVADADRTNMGVDKSVIRIHSDRKWPERVLFDTSLPTITPLQVANVEQSAAVPVTIASAKARVREAFAQLRPLDASQLQSSDSKTREPKRQRQRKITKRHTPPPVLLVERQRQFGWFAYW